jgi:hypothetical protein
MEHVRYLPGFTIEKLQEDCINETRHRYLDNGAAFCLSACPKKQAHLDLSSETLVEHVVDGALIHGFGRPPIHFCEHRINVVLAGFRTTDRGAV